MHPTIRLSSYINQVHGIIDLFPATDNYIIKVLQTGAKIPLNKVVQPFAHKSIIFVWVDAAMVTSNADECDRPKVFAELCDEFCD